MFTRRDGLKLALAATAMAAAMPDLLPPVPTPPDPSSNCRRPANTVNWDRAAANFAKAPA